MFYVDLIYRTNVKQHFITANNSDTGLDTVYKPN